MKNVLVLDLRPESYKEKKDSWRNLLTDNYDTITEICKYFCICTYLYFDVWVFQAENKRFTANEKLFCITMIKETEHLSYGDRLRELELSSLEQRKLWETLLWPCNRERGLIKKTKTFYQSLQ